MSCAFPQWRLPEEALTGNGWSRHYLYDRFAKRIHNKGVILQRPEFESLEKEYPFLAAQCDQVPCGKCIQCRLSYSREWANRCMLELKTSVNAYFITLTYDDSHLSFSPYVDPETGQVETRPVLVPKDLQKFMKRLRFWTSKFDFPRQKFYACGEYGQLTQRPHYHLIVYNLPSEFFENSHVFSNSKEGAPLWTCENLSNLWPFGLAVYGEVNWSTCAYVARYVMKKRKGRSRSDQIKVQAELFPDNPWVHEFVRMSRRPAIARDYFDKYKDKIYLTDECFVTVKDEVQSVKPCRYYDKLYDIDNHKAMRSLKLHRKEVAAMKFADVMTRTDLSEEQYLLMKDRSKEEQAAKLVRPSI